MMIPQLSVRTTNQIQQHFQYGGIQQQAAEGALASVEREQGPIDQGHVQDWLNALWADGTRGPVSEEVAARALKMFVSRPGGPSQIADAPAPFKAGPGGLAVRSFAQDDGRDWRWSIDRKSIDARVGTAEADLSWLLALDLTKPDDFRSFGQWAGWRVDDSTYERGSSWKDPTVQHWILSTLASRHRITRAMARGFIEDLRDTQKDKRVPRELIESARKAIEREAVFDGFLRSLPVLRERMLYERIDETTLRHQLEAELGLFHGAIPPRDFKLMIEDSKSHNDRSDLKELGYTQVIFIHHVLQEVTHTRIATALIDTGLHERKVSDDTKILELARHFEVPVEGVTDQLYAQGVSAVKLFLKSRELYGR